MSRKKKGKNDTTDKKSYGRKSPVFIEPDGAHIRIRKNRWRRWNKSSRREYSGSTRNTHSLYRPNPG
jgi:hypothetical protein